MSRRSMLVIAAAVGYVLFTLFRLSPPEAPPATVTPLAVPDTFPVIARLPNDPSGAWPDSFPLREQDLDMLAVYASLQPFVNRTRAELRTYHRWMEALRQPRPSITIDLVAQLHDDPYAPPQLRAQTASVQERITGLLERIEPDIVAAEGFSLDSLNHEGFFRMVAQLGLILNPIGILDSAGVRQQIAVASQTDGSLRYHERNPDARIMGSEEFNLHCLHQMLLTLPGGSHHPVNQRLIEARSYVALYRLINTMERERHQHGVLVLGHFHEPEVIAYLKAAGIPGTIYRAIR